MDRLPFYLFLLLLIAAVMHNPEWVAQWVFDYQNKLFELQYQAAEEVMK